MDGANPWAPPEGFDMKLIGGEWAIIQGILLFWPRICHPPADAHPKLGR